MHLLTRLWQQHHLKGHTATSKDESDKKHDSSFSYFVGYIVTWSLTVFPSLLLHSLHMNQLDHLKHIRGVMCPPSHRTLPAGQSKPKAPVQSQPPLRMPPRSHLSTLDSRAQNKETRVFVRSSVCSSINFLSCNQHFSILQNWWIKTGSCALLFPAQYFSLWGFGWSSAIKPITSTFGKHLAVLGFFYLLKPQSHRRGEDAGLQDHVFSFLLYLVQSSE